MLTRSNVKLFADDTTLYIEIDNENHTSEILNDDLENIPQWADQWLIKFSPKLMTCFLERKTISPSFNNVMLESVDHSRKYLGLTISMSSNFTWTSHIVCIINTCCVSAMRHVMKKYIYIYRRTLIGKNVFFIH